LPEEVRDALHRGVITERHGRALLRLEDDEEIVRAFRMVAESELRVQDTEHLVDELLGEGKGTGAEEGKRGRRRLAALRDLRIFLNTFRSAVQALQQAGVPARIEERDTGQELVVTVYIGRPGPGAGVARRSGGQGMGGC
jgi:ParB family chromosome partitioning protein